MMNGMRIFILLATLLLTSPAFASGDEAAPQCTLKNTEFCGTWYDKDNFKVVITGDRLIYNETDEPCTLMKEARFEDGRPLSLIKCITTPDLNYPHVRSDPYPVGYLLVLMPRNIWDRSEKYYNARMYSYNETVFTNPCFSDKPIDRDSCDLTSLLDRHVWYAWYPLYKLK
jgi:hypothetical protein